jgi:hypothetical protein
VHRQRSAGHPRSKSDFNGDYAGLTARVVLDREWLDEDCDGGRDVLLESTFDWYAQDDSGNIWYVGEDTTEFLYDDAGVFLRHQQGVAPGRPAKTVPLRA